MGLSVKPLSFGYATIFKLHISGQSVKQIITSIYSLFLLALYTIIQASANIFGHLCCQQTVKWIELITLQCNKHVKNVQDDLSDLQ